MKKKYSRIFGVALILVLLASLFGFAAPVSASNVAWSGIANPSASSTRLNLADCDVGSIAVSPDGGTLFAAVETEVAIPGISTAAGQWALLQSTDGGHNWRATGLISNPGPITGIAISPNFATDGTMYVAAWSGTLGTPAVFRTQNSGTTFTEIKAVTAEAALGTATTVINSIDMWAASPYPYVMVGTNTDVWVLRDAPFGIWRDQEVNAAGPVNIIDVAFAPDFATTNYIWAVTALGVVTTTNSPGAWGTILGDTTALVAAVSADIGFPDGYNSMTAPYLWVALNSGGLNTGGVWRIRGLPGASQAIAQLLTTDIRSIAVSGSMATATILAGQENSARISKSVDGGIMWIAPVLKQPTGGIMTYVVMEPDFATSYLAYVGTSGTESAFQVSGNAGMSWNQTGLIDTPFTAINDVAVVSLDTIFMVSDNYNLWKTEDATATAPVWERILSQGTVTFPMHTLANITFVETSPEFATDGVVYAADSVTGIVKAIDGGNIFAPLPPALAPITTLHVVDATFAFTGAASQVYRTDDGGYSWLPATTAPAVGPPASIISIATSPAGAMPPGQMLVGDASGNVFMSMNSGVTFFPLGVGVTPSSAYVAFDPGYATNSTVYAGGGNVIARFNVAVPTAPWVSIDTTMATSSVINGLVTSPDGTLYGSNGLAGQGVERSLDPTTGPPSPLPPTFERMNRLILPSAILDGLWLVVDETLDVTGSKNVLISINTAANQIMTHTDTLATPVVLTAPEADAIFPRAGEVTLQWETLTGAQMYYWEIARDAMFVLDVDSGFSIYPTDISTAVTAGRTYYWRVRVDSPVAGAPGAPVLSRWSEARTFTTYLGDRPWSPTLTNVQAVYANQVPLKPSFQWEGADWATGYEFMLADNAELTSPLVDTTVSTTAYACTVELSYSSTYFWQVRAISGTSESEWSDVSTFTTMAEPVDPIVIQDVPDIIVEQPDIVIPAAVEVTPVSPGYLLAIIIIGAVLVIFVVVLIVRTRRPV